MIDKPFPCDIGLLVTGHKGDYYEAQDHRGYQYPSPRIARHAVARRSAEGGEGLPDRLSGTRSLGEP